VSNGTAKAELERGGRDRERLGRNIGIALFWLLLCYVIGMSARSIIPSLFWPSLAPVAHVPGLADCAREIDTLDRELIHQAAKSLHAGDFVGSERWLAAWDRRYLALSGGCGALESARKDLLELREGVGSMLETYRDGPWQAHQRIERVLDPLRRALPLDQARGAE
jgi:chorismate mutase